MTTRIENCVYRGSKLVGVLHRGRWHRYTVTKKETGSVEHELVPLEPLLSADQARDLQDCVLAQAPTPSTSSDAAQISERIAWIDKHFPWKPRRQQ